MMRAVENPLRLFRSSDDSVLDNKMLTNNNAMMNAMVTFRAGLRKGTFQRQAACEVGLARGHIAH